MCIPQLLTAISTVGSTMSAMGQADYQAQVAKQNADLARWQQEKAAEKGAEEQRQIDLEKKQMLGQQRAAMGASGIDSSSGSGLAILTDTAYLVGQDKSAARYNAELESWGYGAQATQYDADAANAKMAKTGALFSGLTELGGNIASYRSTKKAQKKTQNPYKLS